MGGFLEFQSGGFYQICKQCALPTQCVHNAVTFFGPIVFSRCLKGTNGRKLSKTFGPHVDPFGPLRNIVKKRLAQNALGYLDKGKPVLELSTLWEKFCRVEALVGHWGHLRTTKSVPVCPLCPGYFEKTCSMWTFMTFGFCNTFGNVPAHFATVPILEKILIHFVLNWAIIFPHVVRYIKIGQFFFEGLHKGANGPQILLNTV